MSCSSRRNRCHAEASVSLSNWIYCLSLIGEVRGQHESVCVATVLNDKLEVIVDSVDSWSSSQKIAVLNSNSELVNCSLAI
jgi:hypothetical protein